MFLLACAIEGDAHQGLCQQISADADGSEKLSSDKARRQGRSPPFPPLFPLNLALALLHSLSHALSFVISAVRMEWALTKCCD